MKDSLFPPAIVINVNVEDESRIKEIKVYKQQGEKHLYEGVVNEIIGLNSEAKRLYSLGVEQLAKAELIHTGVDINDQLLKSHNNTKLLNELDNRGFNTGLNSSEKRDVNGYFVDKYKPSVVSKDEAEKAGKASYKYKAHVDKQLNTPLKEINEHTGYSHPPVVSNEYVIDNQYEAVKKGKAKLQIEQARTDNKKSVK